ncbi:MAG: hypothetical protein R3336_08050 [Phycisphaeraceae bacterium]|nr:hypothetical protein [Phycisphaeraceae bacterium]
MTDDTPADARDAPDTSRVKLKRTKPRTTPPSGWGAILLSLPFIAIGTFVALAGLGVVEVNNRTFDRHDGWFAVAFGLIFAGAGTWTLTKGIRCLLRRKRRQAELAARPDEPWRADYQWDPNGAEDTPLPKAIRYLAIGIVLAALLAPFNWSVFGRDEIETVPLLIVLGFDLFVLYNLGLGGYYALRYFRYGRTRLRYDQFPNFLGDTLEATWIPSSSIHEADRVTFTLRCVEVVTEYTSSTSSSSRKEKYVPYRIWQSQFEFSDVNSIIAGSELPVSFLLPEDPRLSTDMFASRPRYWEVVVNAETPGIDYGATFHVPVYKPPPHEDSPPPA